MAGERMSGGRVVKSGIGEGKVEKGGRIGYKLRGTTLVSHSLGSSSDSCSIVYYNRIANNLRL
uniref:Uncharacterized protein n=1 Tax=Marseillevirus LCMAC101 TaxID=2506602 RepID=A0A481YSP6_9VIRU|nr:MAG: hypothetical protein LCMAC101_06050 [Marseillevirus LCMAC101]